MTKRTITVNELFSGIGAKKKALQRIGIEHKIIGISEIDKYAIRSYEAMYGETFNYGDIRTIERLNYADLWTYSFPCTDISVAGKQEGINENTRSGLLYQVQRLLEIAKKDNTLPKYLLLENVKNLVGKKFKQQFLEWLEYLDGLGYNTYWQVLNAKDYGIPQNRERVYGVSIRKDIDDGKFKFPEKVILNKRLADLLEKEVNESFYLSQKTLEYFINNSLKNEQKGNGFRFKPRHPEDSAVAFSLTTKAGSRMDDNYLIVASRGRSPQNPSDRTKGSHFEQRLEPNSQGISNTLTTVQKDNLVLEKKIIQVGNIKNTERFGGNPTEGRIYSKEGIAPTICAHSDKPKIIQAGNIVKTGNWNNPQRGRIYSTEGISPTINTMQGGGLEPKIIIGSTQKNTAINSEGICPTLTSAMGCGGGHVPMHNYNLRIRKLTPLECWRLMGFDDADFYKAQTAGISNTQLYKQAGNSIVVNVLEKIFSNMFIR